MSNNNLPKLIVILGPTASGKTKLAVDLASKFNGEIVSADSRQVYRGMDIGTGKDLKEYQNIKYHLVDVVQPNQEFTLADYKKLVLEEIEDIRQQGKVPFLVGGTGLYISSVIDNYQIPKVKPNENIRRKLEEMNKQEKIDMIKRRDPLTLDFLDVDNPRRLNRALEVCLSGQKFSELRKKGELLFDTLQIGIKTDREKLNKKIDQRVDEMLEQGLVEETEEIIGKFGVNSAPLQTIGYAEIIDYLKGVRELDKAKELIKIHTHQFAKRQTTWFKRDKRIEWVDANNFSGVEKLVKDFLFNR